jgi:hypothetical protein
VAQLLFLVLVVVVLAVGVPQRLGLRLDRLAAALVFRFHGVCLGAFLGQRFGFLERFLLRLLPRGCTCVSYR